jgi:Ca2+-transporting ATPase
MDGPTSRVASNSAKRRSPPPQIRSRPQSPMPAIQANTSASVNGSVASSSAYTSRTAAVSRSGFVANGSTDYGPAASAQPGNEMTDEPGSAMVDISAEGAPQYAYSTTLRRQPSIEQGIFPRSSSPHRASPYRNRAISNPYSNGHPLTNLDESEYRSREQDQGVLERAMKFGRKMIGKEDYAEVRHQEEEGLADRARRQKETPSSIYAHKTVEVSHFCRNQQITLTSRIRYEISKRTQQRVYPLRHYQL